MQIICCICSVTLNAMATQYICSFNSVYRPHWLVQCGWHCPLMHIPVHSPWLPDVTQTVFSLSFLKILFIVFREGKGRRKTGKETSICGCLLHAPYWGRGLQPRHVPWLGIELVIVWFAGWHSIHWATPARAQIVLIILTMARLFLDRPYVYIYLYYIMCILYMDLIY